MIKGRLMIFLPERCLLTVCEKPVRAIFAIYELMLLLERADQFDQNSAPKKVELFHQI
jgi:hypothetical protein